MTGQAYEYQDGSTTLEGYLATDASGKAKRPGVLVFHEWMGVSDHEKTACDDLAKAGYIALAADIFGKGDRPRNPDEAAQYAGRYRAGDRSLMRQRAAAALAALRAHPQCQTDKIAAIGFCFGGTTALELARAGADLKGVVTFHANLHTERPATAGTLKAKVLALHGAEDPFVPQAEVSGFLAEMRAAHADWQFVQYCDAVHSFTNPAAGNEPHKGFAYNKRAAQRAWAAMREFFKELFS